MGDQGRLGGGNWGRLSSPTTSGEGDGPALRGQDESFASSLGHLLEYERVFDVGFLVGARHQELP